MFAKPVNQYNNLSACHKLILGFGLTSTERSASNFQSALATSKDKLEAAVAPLVAQEASPYRDLYERIFAMNSSPHLNGITIVVIDDELDNLQIAEQLLGFVGARVITTRNAPAGLELIKSNAPELVLLDLAMPGMDGWQALAQLRANPETASLPVIALTAHAMNGDRERALAAGFNAYISKPYYIVTFYEEINRCLAGQNV